MQPSNTAAALIGVLAITIPQSAYACGPPEGAMLLLAAAPIVGLLAATGLLYIVMKFSIGVYKAIKK